MPAWHTPPLTLVTTIISLKSQFWLAWRAWRCLDRNDQHKMASKTNETIHEGYDSDDGSVPQAIIDWALYRSSQTMSQHHHQQQQPLDEPERLRYAGEPARQRYD